MLTLDKKTLHAMEAMLTIAGHTGTQPISGKEIAAEHELPPRYLEQMLQRLVRAELLRGVRGPRGGYVLAREKRRISLADILHATQANNDEEEGSRYDSLSGLLNEIGDDITEKLESVTLQELAPNKASDRKTADFAI